VAYIITHTDGRVYGSIADGVVDDKLGISLIGQSFHNYGQLLANNFLHLLEHQSSPQQPTDPVAGQIWWNSETHVLSFFDGNKFKPCSSSAVSNNPPIKPLKGDQWWDTDANQLKIFEGTDWIVVGPLYTKGQSFSGVLPTTVTDTVSNTHIITLLQVDGQTVGTVSKDAAFTLSTPIVGFTTIKPGITLAANATLTGDSLNSLQLGGIAASNYLVKTATTSSLDGSLSVNGPAGLTVNQLSITSDTFTNAHISSTHDIALEAGNVTLRISPTLGSITSSVEPISNSSITTKLYVDTLVLTANTSVKDYVDTTVSNLIASSPLATLNALSAAIAHDPLFHINTTAVLSSKADKNSPQLTGLPTASTPPTSDNSTRIATTAFVKNLLGGESGSGGMVIAGPLLPTTDNTIDLGSPAARFRNIYGRAISAQYADLAENYTSDAVYLPGTVVVFGGKKEVTTSDQYCDHRIAGVVSTDPAYLMNGQVQGVSVALTGKVPCKVFGPVKKGDILVNSHFTGVAMSISQQENWKPGCVIGKSLETDSSTGIRAVMIAVGRF
jgi:hypothetical protein